MAMFDSSEKRLAESFFFGLLEFLTILVTEFGGLESRRRLLFTELGVHQSSPSPFMAASSGSTSLFGKGGLL